MKKQLIALTAAAALSAGVVSQASAASYSVKSGDTLWSISQANNVSVDQVMDWNDLNSTIIYPNQQLEVDGEAKGKAKKEQSDKSSSASTYTVVSGDTLYKIAKAHGISLDSLMSWNGLSSHLIYPGDKLTVKGGSSVKAVSTATPQAAPAKTQSAPAKSTAEPQAGKTMSVEATAYTAYCAGCSGITATGIDLRSNPNQKVIAVDPRVIPLGSKVWVEGYGTAIAGDTGGAIKGNRIDVFIPSKGEALNFGRKTVKIKVLN